MEQCVTQQRPAKHDLSIEFAALVAAGIDDFGNSSLRWLELLAENLDVHTAIHMELQVLGERFACMSVVAADSLHSGRVAHVVAGVGKAAGIAGDRAVVAIAGVMGIDLTWALVVPELLDTEDSLV